MSNLSQVQLAVLASLAISPGSAYRMGVSLATLQALSSRRLVDRHDTLGWGFSPRTCAWKITEAGRDALAKARGEQP